MKSSPPALASRRGFVLAVRDAFDNAGVDYVFLHGMSDDWSLDSDVDVAIAPTSRRLVDSVLRAGIIGPLVQRVQYDIPWCCCYVVRTGDARRPFRELDVACDPYGLSRLGPVMQFVMRNITVKDGLPSLNSETEAAYLLSKRAWKGLRDKRDVSQLENAVCVDVDAARILMRSILGRSGDRAVNAVAERRDLPEALHSLSDAINRRRLRPRRLALRSYFGLIRLFRRLTKPVGLVVGLVGPDGAGKSTLAEGLSGAFDGVFRNVERCHLTPGLLPPPSRVLRREPRDTSQPHGAAPSGVAGSLLRIGWLATDTAIGWWPRIALAKARSRLVLFERGWPDLLVDPKRYRLSAGWNLVLAIQRVLPRPDMTFVLKDKPARVHARKPELEIAELERQFEVWDRIVEQNGRFTRLEVGETEATIGVAFGAICNHLALRVSDLSGFNAALACLGPPCAHGRRYSLVTARGRARWIVPRAIGARGPCGTGLYRPASARHALGLLAIEARQRLGGAAWPALELDDSDGLAPELAAALDLPRVEIAALLPTDPRRGSRTVLAVLDRGRPIAIAKVAPAGSLELEQERRALSALETASLKTLVVPRPLVSFVWRNFDVLVTTRVPLRGRTDRPLRHTEESALVELATLRDRLAPALGGDGAVPVHGDFCGWNSSALRGGRLALWDWEWAHMGEPLEDWFHWQTQRLIHFGHSSVEELVRSALEPTERLRALYARLGLDTAAAPHGLAASLRHGLATSSPEENGTGRAVRERALAALEGAP